MCNHIVHTSVYVFPCTFLGGYQLKLPYIVFIITCMMICSMDWSSIADQPFLPFFMTQPYRSYKTVVGIGFTVYVH